MVLHRSEYIERGRPAISKRCGAIRPRISARLGTCESQMTTPGVQSVVRSASAPNARLIRCEPAYSECPSQNSDAQMMKWSTRSSRLVDGRSFASTIQGRCRISRPLRTSSKHAGLPSARTSSLPNNSSAFGTDAASAIAIACSGLAAHQTLKTGSGVSSTAASDRKVTSTSSSSRTVKDQQ